RTVLAADTVHHNAARRRPRDRADTRGGVLAKMGEERQIEVARDLCGVGRAIEDRLELALDALPVALVRLHERRVHDLDRQLRRRIVAKLVVSAQVDRGADAVLDGGAPAGIRQLPDAVGADDPAVARLAAVARRVAAEVAD